MAKGLALLLADRALRISFLRSTGEDLPNTKSFALFVGAIAFLAGFAAMVALGREWLYALGITALWVGVTWMLAESAGENQYRAAATVYLGSVPVLLAMVALLLLIGPSEIINVAAGLWLVLIVKRLFVG